MLLTFLADPKQYPFEDGNLFLGLSEHGEVGVNLERHAIAIAGSRSGKGAACIIPNLLRWPHNALVIDPKGENAEITYEQREAMGQDVYVLDPFKIADVPDRIRASFNPLISIDLTSNRARATISAIANGLVVVHNAKNMEWTDGARALIAGIIAYVVAEAPPEERNFAAVRAILMQPTNIEVEEGEEPQGLYADAQRMAYDTRLGGLIRSAGITIMTAIESEKGMEKDFLGLARRSTEWLDDEAISTCLNQSTFELSELKTGNASIYLVLPADTDFLATYGAFLRLFVKASITAMGVGQSGKKCLFILDEFYSLGKLEELSEAAGRMPSYGVHLFPFLQHLGQLKELYGADAMETFFANADAAIFFGNIDTVTTDYVSKRIGNITPQELNITPPIPSSGKGMPYGDPDIDRLKEMLSSAVQADYQEMMTDYNNRSKEIGRPRLSSDMVSKITGKQNRDSIALSMFVFASAGDILHLALAPYFKQNEPAPLPVVSKEQPPLQNSNRAEHIGSLLHDKFQVLRKNREKEIKDEFNDKWFYDPLKFIAALVVLILVIRYFMVLVFAAVVLAGYFYLAVGYVGQFLWDIFISILQFIGIIG